MACCSSNPYTNPTVEEFKLYFARDFVYGASCETVTDADIQRAIDMTASFINPDLFCDQSAYTQGFMLLSAHFLVMNMRAATQGVNGQFTWLSNSKAVGSVSQGFTIPDRILANPEYAMLSLTYYGAQFLFLILPQLSGQIFVVAGDTLP